jgi:hypothetical protein
MSIEEEVKKIIEADRAKKIESIEEEVYNIIKDNNGKFDLVDIACKFPDLTVDIPSVAVYRLVQEGRVERKEMYGNRCAYFTRD